MGRICGVYWQCPTRGIPLSGAEVWRKAPYCLTDRNRLAAMDYRSTGYPTRWTTLVEVVVSSEAPPGDCNNDNPRKVTPLHTRTMVILCVSGGTIYNVVYIFEVYYIPTQQALDLTKSQMGTLMGVFGAVSLLSYSPGGWLADRVSSRKLITLAMLLTGGSGFYYATFPSYRAVALVLHAFWGITIALIFWNAMIRATRNWAPSSQQGRAFGFLEAGRGLAGVAPASILLGVFSWLGSTRLALATVISSWSAIIVLCGVAAWFVLEDDIPSANPKTDGEKPKVGWKDVVQVLTIEGRMVDRDRHHGCEHRIRGPPISSPPTRPRSFS